MRAGRRNNATNTGYVVGLSAVLLLLLTLSPARADLPEFRWGIGPWGGAYQYVGGGKDRAGIGPEAGLLLKLNVTDRAGFQFRGSYGFNEDKDVSEYETTVYGLDALFQVRLLTDGPVRPYLTWGGGLHVWKSELGGADALTAAGEKVEGSPDGDLKAGLGVEVDLSPRVTLDLRATGSRLLRADTEMPRGGIADPNGGRVQLSLGLVFNVVQPIPLDTDSDGVRDKRDRCPGTPLGALVDGRGCPTDTDGDGVFDGVDQCPNTIPRVIVDARGCPKDSDGDGVPNGLDESADTPPGAEIETDN